VAFRNASEASALALSAFSSILPLVSYALCSMSLGIINKLIHTRFHFKSERILFLSQHLASLVFITILYALPFFSKRATSFSNKMNLRLPAVSKLRTRSLPLLQVAMSNLANIICCGIVLKIVNIPMLLTLRRLTTTNTFLISVYTSGIWPNRRITLSVFLITFGALVAGANDLNADYYGYALVIFNNTVTSLSTEVLSKVSKKYNDITFCDIYIGTTLITTPVLFLLCLFYGDFEYLLKADYLADPYFIFLVGLSTVMGICITISSQLCTIYNSPLATTISGNTKGVASTILGVILFNDVVLNNLMITGLILSLGGATLYSVTKYRETQSNATKKKVGKSKDS